MIPDFIVVGAQKAGTGFLMDVLGKHPDLYMKQKEIKYFCYKNNYKKGRNWYLQHFPTRGKFEKVGEKSPDYFWLDSGVNSRVQNIAERIKNDLGFIKIIISLRDPIRRAISAYNHHLYHRGRRIFPFDAFSGHINEVLQNPGHSLNKEFGLIQMGYYRKHVSRYLDIFGEENILILNMEMDIVGNPSEGINKVCDFLNVTRIDFDNYVNRKRRKPSKFSIVTSYFLPVFRPLLRQLRKMDSMPEFYAEPNYTTISYLKDHYKDHYKYCDELFNIDIKEVWY